MKAKTRYYSDFNTDFSESREQDFTLPESYEWVRCGPRARILSALTYGTALVFSSVWCRLALHMKIIGAKKLRKSRGAFIYANHTQPIGDVFMPALAAFPSRIYTLVSPSNYGIPFIAKLLPYLGALPVPRELKKMRSLSQAMEHHLKRGKNIVIYPEGHVWEYFTKIRPFSETAFHFPVKYEKPSFCITSVYKKRKFFKKPRLLLYVDGPFFPKNDLPVRERASELCERIRERMILRSKLSDTEYIKYEYRSAESIRTQ